MAKKHRVHVNFRVTPDTYKEIKRLARKAGVSEGVAVDRFVASTFINDAYIKNLEEELRKLTNNSPAF